MLDWVGALDVSVTDGSQFGQRFQGKCGRGKLVQNSSLLRVGGDPFRRVGISHAIHVKTLALLAHRVRLFVWLRGRGRKA